MLKKRHHVEYARIYSSCKVTAMIRLDFIFSYWLVAWYAIYMFNGTSFNPKVGLLVGLIENVVMLGTMLFFATFENIVYFLVVNFFIKILPLYSLRTSPLTLRDTYAFFGLFGIYLVWIYANSVYFGESVQAMTVESLLQNKNETPGIQLLHMAKNRLMNVL